MDRPHTAPTILAGADSFMQQLSDIYRLGFLVSFDPFDPSSAFLTHPGMWRIP